MPMNNFPGGEGALIDYFLVTNKAGDDPETHDGSMRLMNPRTMNPQNVNSDDMAFSGSMFNPSQMGQQSFPGRLDPGTLVYGIKIPGQNQAIILGQAQTQKKAGAGGGAGAGGSNLLGGYGDVFSSDLPISTPPDIRETTDADGVKIRKIVEKGQKHNFNLLDGLPSHGALFDMTGFKLPEINKVPTAKQKNTQMMSQGMMDGMMGQIMSMSQMFQGLMGNRGNGGGGGGMGAPMAAAAMPAGNLGANSVFTAAQGTPMANILASLSPQMATAVSNMSKLVQGLETTNGVAFFTGNVVHEDTFLTNAELLLSQVTSIDDLMYVLQRLQWDTTLFGHDKLTKVVTELQTAWGVALQEISFDGEIVVTYKDENRRDLVYNVTSQLICANANVSNVTINGWANTVNSTGFWSNTPNSWIASLGNMGTTIGLAEGSRITANDYLGSFGSNVVCHVVSISNTTSLIFTSNASSNTVNVTAPKAGSVANVSCVKIVANTVGYTAMVQYAETMASPASSPSLGSAPAGGSGGGSGGGAGQIAGKLQGMMGNLFGRSSGTMQDMWGRLSKSGEQEAKKMHQKLNQDMAPKKMSQISDDTNNGKNPLESIMNWTQQG